MSREGRRAAIQAELDHAGGAWQPPTKKLVVTFREFLISGLGEEALAEEVVRNTPASERRRVDNVEERKTSGPVYVGTLQNARRQRKYWR